MSDVKYGLTIAVKEHLLSGKPITRLEALILYGISNLTGLIWPGSFLQLQTLVQL